MPSSEAEPMRTAHMAHAVHWYFSGQELCEEYAMGDDVLDDSNGTRSQVTCPECLDWIHA